MDNPKIFWTRNCYQGVSRCRSLFWYILSVQKYIHLIVEMGFDPLNSWQIFSITIKYFKKLLGLRYFCFYGWKIVLWVSPKVLELKTLLDQKYLWIQDFFEHTNILDKKQLFQSGLFDSIFLSTWFIVSIKCILWIHWNYEIFVEVNRPKP